MKTSAAWTTSRSPENPGTCSAKMKSKTTSGLVTIEELIEIVPAFPCIAVTGPERSGTTITTEMISSSTGYTNVPEETWDNSFDSLWQLLRERDRVVVHAPHLTFRV